MNRPPKNRTSVTRNTHMPSVAASFCCSERVEVMLQRRVMVRVRAPAARDGRVRQR